MLALLALPLRNARKLHMLAFASCVFYAAWDYRYLTLLLAISAIDYYAASWIEKSERPHVRRALVLGSVISNLSILGYFKYANFFLENVNALTGHGGHLDVLLPAGISFYTFKTMSYTIDVYRRRIKAVRSLLDYTTFVTFFPELIAGPIVRASVFLPQMSRQIGPTRARLQVGGSLFLVGLTKKIVLADRLATVADPIFAQPHLYSSGTVWCGVLAYTLQIYCDFSGYSDMAVGTAKMIGYDLPENFDMPYLSANVTEFWRRWHMTLSTWLRDYLYIPLGGNRVGVVRTYVNLMLTMLLGGLWHGASWNFVLWGALHGLALAFHRWYQTKNLPRLPKPIGIAVTFLFVMLCWVPFRAPSFAATVTILHRMGSVGLPGARWYPSALGWAAALLALGHGVGEALRRDVEKGSGLASSVLTKLGWTLTQNPTSGWSVTLGVSRVGGTYVLALWILGIYFLAATASSPFIYFQF